MREPYWASRDGRVTLYHGDSLEVLPTFPADSAQMVCTDPPYAEQTHQGARTGNPRSSKKLVTFASLTADDIRARFAAAGRVARRWLVATMEFRHVAALEVSPPDGYTFIRAGVWTKRGYMPQTSGDRPAQGWEAIAILHRSGGRMRWNGGGRSAVWHHTSERDGEYPTQKPVALVRDFVSLFSDKGDTVLDPFCGSGTSLVAALGHGRRAIGIDISEDALRIARARCEAVIDQGSLFP